MNRTGTYAHNNARLLTKQEEDYKISDTPYSQYRWEKIREGIAKLINDAPSTLSNEDLALRIMEYEHSLVIKVELKNVTAEEARKALKKHRAKVKAGELEDIKLKGVYYVAREVSR